MGGPTLARGLAIVLVGEAHGKDEVHEKNRDLTRVVCRSVPCAWLELQRSNEACTALSAIKRHMLLRHMFACHSLPEALPLPYPRPPPLIQHS